MSDNLSNMAHLNMEEQPITLTAESMKKGRLSVVALGRTGEGKSSVLNSILRFSGHTGDNVFEEKAALFSVTKEIKETSVVLPNNVVARLIDTVGFFDTEETEGVGHKNQNPIDIAAATLDEAHKMVLSKLLEMIHFCPNGIHAFLIVVGVGRMTREVVETFQLIISYFGTQLLQYCIFVFTKIDLTPEISCNDIWKGVDTVLGRLGYSHSIEHQSVFVNNREKDPRQVTKTMEQLFSVIEANLERNGGTPYVNAFFEKAQNLMKEEKARVLREVEEKFNNYFKEKMKEQEQEFQKKFDDMKKEHTDQLEKVSKENTEEREKLVNQFNSKMEVERKNQEQITNDLKKKIDEQAKLDAQLRLKELEKIATDKQQASEEHKKDMMKLKLEIEKDRMDRHKRNAELDRRHKKEMEQNRLDWEEAQQIPKGCENLQQEVELGIIIGKTASKISCDSALNFIAGYALALDMTARDFQDEAKKKGSPWVLAKGFDGSCPVSSGIPAANVADPHKLELICHINGKAQQHGNTSDMIFNVPAMLQYITQYITLEQGDLVLTGTPEGVCRVNSGDKIECWLKQDTNTIINMAFNVQ